MTAPPREMPVYTRTFDLLSWLLPVPRQDPRAHRQDFMPGPLAAAGDPRKTLEPANLARGVRRHRQLTPTPAVPHPGRVGRRPRRRDPARGSSTDTVPRKTVHGQSSSGLIHR